MIFRSGDDDIVDIDADALLELAGAGIARLVTEQKQALGLA